MDELVSILTPTLNQPEGLARMLAGFKGCGVPHEHIIFDSSPESYACTRYTKDCIVRIQRPFPCETITFATANNRMAKAAQGQWLLLCNDDVEPLPGLLEGMLKVAEVPGTDVVGVRLLYPDGLIQHGGVGFDSHFGPWHLYRFAPGDHPPANIIRPVAVVTFACTLIRHELWDDLNGLDENFAWAYEDVDFCLRAREAGSIVGYAGQSAAVHHEGATRGRLNDIANWQYFARKWIYSGRLFSVLGIWPQV